MKKLIAVILAVLLLGSAVAYAETGSALDLKDPVLDVTVDGETAHLDLAGLTLRFGAVGEEENAMLVLNILGNDELLFKAAAKVDGERVLLAADGLSHSYAVAMPGAGLVGNSEEDSGISAFSGELMEKIMAEAELGMEGDKITFRLPYTAVNSLLREILPTLDKVPNADELIQELDEMEANGEGFELSGSVSMGANFHAELNLVPVKGGEPAGEPAFTALFDLEQVEDGGDFYLSVIVPSEGAEPIFRLEGSFRSGDQGVTVQLKLFVPESGSAAPVATVDLAIGEDFSLRIDVVDVFRFEAGYQKASSLVTLAAEADGFEAKLTATAVSGEADLQACAFPAEVIELGGELSEEQSETLSTELMTALTPVINFLLPSLASSGLMG